MKTVQITKITKEHMNIDLSKLKADFIKIYDNRQTQNKKT